MNYTKFLDKFYFKDETFNFFEFDLYFMKQENLELEYEEKLKDKKNRLSLPPF